MESVVGHLEASGVKRIVFFIRSITVAGISGVKPPLRILRPNVY